MLLKLKYIAFFLFFIMGIQFSAISQIDDIKDKSKENKENKENKTGNNNSDDSNNNDVGDAFLSGCFSGCVDAGCSIFTSLIAEYTAEVFKMRETDPSIFSFDIYGVFAPGLHLTSTKNYTYFNYLPGIRANLASFMIDFRFNILTEFTDDVPNSFKSWDLNLAFNIVPSEKFKLSLGGGVQREMTGASYFQEYFFDTKIGIRKNRDNLNFDFRCSADYETKIIPFLEAGARYNWRFIEMPNLYGYFTLGGMYQNYYQSHEIWAIRAGILLNLH